MLQFINVLSTWIIPVLISVTIHEAAHGYTANLLGDDTAKKLGRVTLNPFKHIDNFGTIYHDILYWFDATAINGFREWVDLFIEILNIFFLILNFNTLSNMFVGWFAYIKEVHNQHSVETTKETKP